MLVLQKNKTREVGGSFAGLTQGGFTGRNKCWLKRLYSFRGDPEVEVSRVRVGELKVRVTE